MIPGKKAKITSNNTKRYSEVIESDNNFKILNQGQIDSRMKSSQTWDELKQFGKVEYKNKNNCKRRRLK